MEEKLNEEMQKNIAMTQRINELEQHEILLDVAADLAERCEVQLAYSIGVAEPVSVTVNTFGTGKISDEELDEGINKVFDFSTNTINDLGEISRNHIINNFSKNMMLKKYYDFYQKII